MALLRTARSEDEIKLAISSRSDETTMRPQSRLFGVCRNPRFQVGLIRISLTHTRGGMLATKAMVRPRSSDCSIRACSCSEGTTGRSFRIGVGYTTGDRQHARNPLTHSSMLKE